MRLGDLYPQKGVLWRRLANYLGDRRITPAIITPLLEHMGATQKDITDREFKRDISMLAIGYRLWREEPDKLIQWACSSTTETVTEELVEEWWWSGERQLFLLDEQERVDEFFNLLSLNDDERNFLAEFEATYPSTRPLYIYYIRQHLPWLGELETFRDMANRTWSGENSKVNKVTWSAYEFQLADKYYSDQQPFLEILAGDEINPFTLSTSYFIPGGEFGLPELAVDMTLMLRSAMIDFVNEILDCGQYHSVRGSIRCAECGQFVERRPRGYGQQYCSEPCKKRAAKRRYRSRRFQKVLQ